MAKPTGIEAQVCADIAARQATRRFYVTRDGAFRHRAKRNRSRPAEAPRITAEEAAARIVRHFGDALSVLAD